MLSSGYQFRPASTSWGVRWLVTAVTCMGLSSIVQAEDEVRIGGMHGYNSSIVKEWVAAFREQRASRSTEDLKLLTPWYRDRHVLRFAKGECEVLVHHRPLTELDEVTLLWKFGEKALPVKRHVAGQYRVVLAVNRGNPTSALTVKTIGVIFADRAALRDGKWRSLGWLSPSPPVCYGEGDGDRRWAEDVLQRKTMCLRDKPKRPH